MNWVVLGVKKVLKLRRWWLDFIMIVFNECWVKTNY